MERPRNRLLRHVVSWWERVPNSISGICTISRLFGKKWNCVCTSHLTQNSLTDEELKSKKHNISEQNKGNYVYDFVVEKDFFPFFNHVKIHII